MRSALRATVATTVATGLVASTLALAAPTGATESPRAASTVTLSVLDTPHIGRFCTIGVTLSTSEQQLGGRVVLVQRYSKGRWVSFITKTTRSVKPVKVRLRSATPVRFRAKFAGTAKVAADTSNVVTCTPKSLRYGSRSLTVAKVHNKLRNLGIRPASEGRVFNANTLQAVYAFQKSKGLPRTGVIDVKTYKRMMRTTKVARPGWCGAETTACVDISRQAAYLKFGKKRYVIPISSGGEYYFYNKQTGLQELARTPRGRYSVYFKRPGTTNGPLGTYYWMSFFTGGYGIHGSNSVPTGPASHGCIRVPRTVEQWVYRNLPVGSTVHVHD